jgi:hypothetical protein
LPYAVRDRILVTDFRFVGGRRPTYRIDIE